jgi:Holliday junction resolvase
MIIVISAYQDQHDKKEIRIGKKQRIPDILAKKGRAEHLIEVETKDTIKKDRDQLETFTRSAAHKPGRVFKIKKVK